MAFRHSLKQFIALESFAGILLFLAALLALIISNSALYPAYHQLQQITFGPSFGSFHLVKSLELWVNEGLMSIFFFLIGLEIKKELVVGELNSLNKVMLPGLAALGGMLVPAVIYILITGGHYFEGWAIPTATDIAFSLGILSLLGQRVPMALKVFLMSVAIFDDIGAILIIAFFYTADLSIKALGIAALFLLVLLVLNHFQVKRLLAYLGVGLLMWVAVIKSGVHATLAGFLIAIVLPKEVSHPTQRASLEDRLHPWVAYLVLPVFAFVNSGIHFSTVGWSVFFQPVTIAIACGLFFGKQFGIGFTIWLSQQFKLAPLPSGTTVTQLYGVALLCGVGFTMSLFIGMLAFREPQIITWVKVGVMAGSICSGLFGYWLLSIRTAK